MPKTRKKRGEKVQKIQAASKEETKDTLENDLIENINLKTVDSEGHTESTLRTELKAELKRLQDEYKRQKQLTVELEQRLDRRQTQSSGADKVTEIIETQPKGVAQKDIDVKYPDTTIGPIFDDQFKTDFDIERQFTSTLENIRSDIMNINQTIDSKLDKEAITELQTDKALIENLTNKVNDFNKDLQRFGKALGRTDEKLDAVLLDLGFEESLDINKVPNYLLVLVYETILNDIINRIKHIHGLQDTEVTVIKILENVRSHTSGGELFIYEHNVIKIPELKQYLDNKMISPRQIHLTFNSIIDRLVEYAPGYTPKNFKAMIKIMSQEYAVEHVSLLHDRFDELEEDVADMKKNINKFIAKYKEKVVNQQFNEEEIKNLGVHITKLVERVDNLPKTIENTIDNMIDEKMKSTLSNLNQTDHKKNISQDPKQEFDEELDSKPIFSKGVIELGDSDDQDVEDVKVEVAKKDETPKEKDSDNSKNGLKDKDKTEDDDTIVSTKNNDK